MKFKDLPLDSFFVMQAEGSGELHAYIKSSPATATRLYKPVEKILVQWHRAAERMKPDIEVQLLAIDRPET